MAPKYPVTAKSHTPEGIASIGRRLIIALTDRYMSLAESMFEWSDDSGKCDTMFEISRKHVPERYLLQNSRVAIFDYAGETHMLPVSDNGCVNIYGFPTEWRVIPSTVGTTLSTELQHLRLNNNNSVIMENSLHGTLDAWVIQDMVTMMVDTTLTLYQRTLWSRNPAIISVGDLKDSDASSFMSAILNFAPAIVKNTKGSMLKTEVLDMNTSIDPKIMEAISHFKSQLLTYIGYEASDIHKRAQQSVAETLLPQSEVKARWKEKLKCRQQAVDVYNKKFGNNLKVECICEELESDENVGLGPFNTFGESSE